MSSALPTPSLSRKNASFTMGISSRYTRKPCGEPSGANIPVVYDDMVNGDCDISLQNSAGWVYMCIRSPCTRKPWGRSGEGKATTRKGKSKRASAAVEQGALDMGRGDHDRTALGQLQSSSGHQQPVHKEALQGIQCRCLAEQSTYS